VEKRTHAWVVHNFDDPLLAFTFTQAQPHCGCMCEHMATNWFLRVLNKGHSARGVCHDLVGDYNCDVEFLTDLQQMDVRTRFTSEKSRSIVTENGGTH
jgi:hypothetical protein